MMIEGMGLFGILLLAGDIYAAINIFQSGATTSSKVFWMVLILLLPALGLIIWFFAGPRERAS